MPWAQAPPYFHRSICAHEIAMRASAHPRDAVLITCNTRTS